MKFFFIGIINTLFVCSCKSQISRIVITSNPVFSEVDTFDITKYKHPFSKHDYFLVKGNFSDKQLLKNTIDNFVKINAVKEFGKYGNYILFFYKESYLVNKKEIQKMEADYRYKIFIYNKDEDFIASYYFSNSFQSEYVNFQSKFR